MLSHKILPNISIDCVIFGFDSEKLNVLLVERELLDEKGNVIIKDYTLTGYHILEDEDLNNSAYNILKNLTGLDNIYLEQFYTFGSIDRIDEGKDRLWQQHLNLGFSERIISVGYYSLINNDKVAVSSKDRKIQWFPIDSIPLLDMAFDHKQIFYKALDALQNKMKLEPIGFELLPDKFTLTQLQKLFESLSGLPIEKRNFRKKIAKLPYIVPLKEKQKGVSHKPAQLFLFSREVYEKTRKEKSFF